MKMKQLLPIALIATMLTPAAFAATPAPTTPTNTASQQLQLTVDPFINIWVKGSHSQEPIKPKEDYTKFDLETALSVDFGVITNKNDEKILLTVKDSTLNTLLATDGNILRIAFVNQTPSAAVNQAAVDAALKKSGKDLSPNVIAMDFDQTTTFELGGKTPTADIGSDDEAGKSVTYTLHSGTYNFNFKSKMTETESFSTSDESGTYKTTITLSQTGV